MGIQGTILTFEATLLGLLFGTTTHSLAFNCLQYWLKLLASCSSQAYWLGSYGAPKDP